MITSFRLLQLLGTSFSPKTVILKSYFLAFIFKDDIFGPGDMIYRKLFMYDTSF